MLKLISLALIAALASTSIAVGCGSDSSPTALTKTEFIEQADAICAQADEKQEAGFKQYLTEHPGDRSNKAGQEKVVKAVGLPPIQTEAEELDDLGAPEGSDDEVEEIVKGIEDAVEKAEAEPSSMLNASGGPFAEVNELAAAYGLTVCSDAL